MFDLNRFSFHMYVFNRLKYMWYKFETTSFHIKKECAYLKVALLRLKWLLLGRF